MAVIIISRFKFNDETSEQAIDMYLNKNMTTIEISNYFNCSDSTVGKMLRLHNIDVNTIGNLRKNKIPIEKWDEIKYKYLNENMTSIELADIYNTSDITITKILRKIGVEIRPAIKRSHIKYHDYFYNIDSVSKAYFLGWLISDGAVIEHKTRPNRNDTISLEVKSDDRYILEMFAEELGSDKSHIFNTVRKNGYEHSYFRFTSQEMSDDLKKYGVVYRKSHKSYLPKIEKDLMPHLIRGIFDGDGTNYIQDNKYMRFGFYGNYDICFQIQEYLCEEIGIHPNKIFDRESYGSKCYMVLYSGNKTSQKFYDLIYKNCEKYYLKRKKDKFDKILCV